MFTRATRSVMQILLSICPRLDAAAVCTRALWPSRRIVSTIPSAVRGLTKQSAPSAGVVPGGRTRHCAALMQRYCAYIEPPRIATVLPVSACAAGDEPDSTTMPAPSLPTGSDCSRRPPSAFITAGEMLAVTTGWSAVPDALAALISAPANSRPWSDGLIGAASMRTMTSSAFGSGVGVWTMVISTMPSVFTGERLGRRRGGDQALRAAADEIAPARLDERPVHDEPVTRLEELHQRALRLPIAQLLDRVDARHRERVDAGVIDAGCDVHRRRDEVLHLARPVPVPLQEDRQLDHVLDARARMARDEVGHQVLLLARALARALELAGECLELAVARLFHQREHAVGLMFWRYL